MSKTIPLDEQIVATLTGACTSEQACAVAADAQRVLKDLTTQADAADVASLSPLASVAEARVLRQKAGDYRFEADRMEASVSALDVRVAVLKSEEADRRYRADWQAVIDTRDALAADIAAHYPGIMAKLTDLAKRITESDQECARLKINETAESIGRSIPSSFYHGGGPLFRIIDRAPPTVDGSRLAWEHTVMHGWRWHGLLETAA